MNLLNKVRTLKRPDSKDPHRQIIVDEKEMKTVTRKGRNVPSNQQLSKSKSTVSSASGSSALSTADIIDFTVSIEALDGIISTNTGGRHKNIGQLGGPVFGVISYSQKVSGNANVIKTNIPSMPLVKSASSIGNRERYQAAFGYPDGNVNALEQVQLTLPMNKSRTGKSGFRPRHFDLTLSLMRGSEVMKLGVASITLCGDECGESKLVAIGQEKTVHTTRMKGNRPVSHKSKTTVGARSASFINDPSRRFSLQRSTLRVTIVAKQRTGNGATSAYLQRASKTPYTPVTELLSFGFSDTVSVITGAMENGSSSFEVVSTIQSHDSDDSLLNKVSAVTLSRSDESKALESQNYFLREDGKDGSLHESDFDSADDESTYCPATSLGFMKFDDNSTVDGSAGESTFLDNVSLGSIKFKDIGNVGYLDAGNGIELTKGRSPRKRATLKKKKNTYDL